MATEPKTRKPRKLETREFGERPQGWKPPSLLPVPDPVPGFEYRWIRKSSYGQDDPSNLSKKLREGYEPVKVSDHPELAIAGNEKGEAEFGGLLLCRIPSEFLEQKRAYYSGQARQQIQSVESNYMSDDDPRMRKFADNKSEVKFGNG